MGIIKSPIQAESTLFIQQKVGGKKEKKKKEKRLNEF